MQLHAHLAKRVKLGHTYSSTYLQLSLPCCLAPFLWLVFLVLGLSLKRQVLLLVVGVCEFWRLLGRRFELFGLHNLRRHCVRLQPPAGRAFVSVETTTRTQENPATICDYF